MTTRRDGASPSDYNLLPVFHFSEPRLSVLPFSRERAGVIRARAVQSQRASMQAVSSSSIFFRILGTRESQTSA